MQVLETILSNDGATKQIVELDDGYVVESTYIRYPNKDIVCLPTQTSCKMGCKFCFLTTHGADTKLRNLYAVEMTKLAMLAQTGIVRRPLLVSFMGSGEPMNNGFAMIDAMMAIRSIEPDTRFAFATMLPKKQISHFLTVMDEISEHDLQAKMHLSLHFTNDATRQEYMPNAREIKTSISLLETYHRVTDNPVEIHYTLLAGVNDQWEHATDLSTLVYGRDIPVKILHHSENPVLGAKQSKYVDLFVNDLKALGVKAEYYKPNGLDIGSSCGQFNLDRYKRN